MDNAILVAMITAGGMILGAVANALTQRISNRRELEISRAEKASLTDRHGELKQEYKQLLNERAMQSKRKISYQVAIMEDKIKEVRELGRTPEVSVLGINATGPLHQGREVLLELLRKGGKLRVLLLDPNQPAFAKRCAKEGDRVGRIIAELFASFYILLDVRTQAARLDPASANRMEVRLLSTPPDRSLIMVNPQDPDGVMLENPYPEEPGKRGAEGEQWLREKAGPDREAYLENVDRFNSLWDDRETRRIELGNPSEMLQISTWPFVIRD